MAEGTARLESALGRRRLARPARVWSRASIHALAASVLAGLAALVLAVPPALGSEARELIEEAARRNGTTSWRDRTLDLVIESRGGEGVTRTRAAEVSESRDPEAGHRTFMEFTGPADVEGVLYLHLAPAEGEAQEWVYVPGARRARRLTPGQSDETNTGAELGYREVERATQVLAWDEDEAEASLVGEETEDGRVYRVLRLVPRDVAKAGVESVDLWLGAEDLLLYRLVPRGGPGALKEVRLADYETISGHATPGTVHVTGPNDTWHTVYRLSDVQYDVGLGDRTFSLARLNRGR